MSRAVDARVRERVPRGGQRDVGERLVLGRHPPLADPRPLDDPLVGGVDERARSSFVTTRSGTARPRPVMPMRHPVGRADHVAISRPRRSGCHAPRAGRRHGPSPCRVRSGPAPGRSRSRARARRRATTIRLNRQSSIPAKNAILPRFSSSTSTATAPVCAIASTIRTPGITGRSGKWPGEPPVVRRHLGRATTRWPGSSSSTSSRAGTARGAEGSARSPRARAGSRGRHARSLLARAADPALSGRRGVLTFPAASQRDRRRTRPQPARVQGIADGARGASRARARAPLTRTSAAPAR